jgi:hypothetical protein
MDFCSYRFLQPFICSVFLSIIWTGRLSNESQSPATLVEAESQIEDYETSESDLEISAAGSEADKNADIEIDPVESAEIESFTSSDEQMISTAMQSKRRQDLICSFLPDYDALMSFTLEYNADLAFQTREGMLSGNKCMLELVDSSAAADPVYVEIHVAYEGGQGYVTPGHLPGFEYKQYDELMGASDLYIVKHNESDILLRPLFENKYFLSGGVIEAADNCYFGPEDSVYCYRIGTFVNDQLFTVACTSPLGDAFDRCAEILKGVRFLGKEKVVSPIY